jgi:branched-chain amino acid transport system substrate-binding protein
MEGKNMKKALYIAFMIGGMAIWVGPSYSANKEPVKIGCLSIFSGKIASLGAEVKAGVMVALKEKPTVLGRPIEIIYEDVETRTDLAVRKAEKVAFKDDVVAILDGGGSAQVIAIAGTLPRLKVPMVSTLAMTTKLYNVHENFYRGGQLADDQVTNGLLRVLEKDPDLKNRKWYILVLDNAYGHDSAKSFLTDAQPNNIQIVNTQYDVAPTETVDWGTYISKIKASGATGLFTALWSAQTAVLHQQAYDFGIMKSVKHVGAGMPLESGVEACGPPCSGIISAINYSWDIDTPASKKFGLAYWEINKMIPSHKGATAYTAAMLLFNAIEKAGSTDKEKIAAALANTSFDGPYGTVRMGKDHSVRHDVICIETKEASANPYGAKMVFKVLMTVPANEVGPPEPAALTPGKMAP